MKTLPATKSKTATAAFSFHGVKVRYNVAHQPRNPEWSKAVEAYHRLDWFNEGSQIRLTRRFLVHFKALFASDLKRILQGDKVRLRCVYPKVREILLEGHPAEWASIIPPFWTPEDRLAWQEYLDTPAPKKLQKRTVKFKGVTIESGHVFQYKTNLKALARLAKPGETVLQTSARVTRLAARELKAA